MSIQDNIDKNFRGIVYTEQNGKVNLGVIDINGAFSLQCKLQSALSEHHGICRPCQ